MFVLNQSLCPFGYKADNFLKPPMNCTILLKPIKTAWGLIDQYFFEFMPIFQYLHYV